MTAKTKNLLIVIVGAFVIAVLVALIVQISMGRKKQEAAPVVEEAKVEILVADKALKMGDELSEDSARWQSWPEGALFGGAVIREDTQKPLEALSGRLARNVEEDEPLTTSVIIGESKGNFVAASLEPGMRALAIEVSASSMVGGFIGPGDFVDVVLTYRQSIRIEGDDPVAKQLVAENLSKSATETIIQNVKVLAIDQMATRPEEDKIKVGKTITLELKPQDVERVALAQEMGKLTLILRGVGDDAIVKKTWETISDVRLISVDDEIYKEYETQKKDSGKNNQIMRIYNGADVQSVTTPE